MKPLQWKHFGAQHSAYWLHMYDIVQVYACIIVAKWFTFKTVAQLRNRLSMARYWTQVQQAWGLVFVHSITSNGRDQILSTKALKWKLLALSLQLWYMDVYTAYLMTLTSLAIHLTQMGFNIVCVCSWNIHIICISIVLLIKSVLDL